MNSGYRLLIAILLIAVLAGGVFLVLPQEKESTFTIPNTNEDSNVTSPETEDSSQDTSILPDESSTTAEFYTLFDVGQHNSKEDCWLVIHGGVYDVTSYIKRHPGGNAILEGCGKDATSLFETRPSGSGTPHSQRARNTLEEYYIGELSE